VGRISNHPEEFVLSIWKIRGIINGRRTDFDKPTTPCFVETYAGISPLPIKPACDATLQMDPLIGKGESLMGISLEGITGERV
jgi:hypothetical protein